MNFAKRATVERSDFYVRRIWTADDGVHRVSEFKSKLERRTVFYAERRDASGWDYISQHRRRGPALAACQRDGN